MALGASVPTVVGEAADTVGVAPTELEVVFG
jgi:hypothetical protein